MLKFDLIQAGLIEITQEEGVKDSRPTSSLLQGEGCQCVIDTEHPKEDGMQYVAAFGRLKVPPASVDCVIFTHLHPDHIGHKHLFPNATFIFHRDEPLGFYFSKNRRLVLGGDALLTLTPGTPVRAEQIGYEPDLRALGDQIYIRHAPGHTPGSTMIFALIEGLIYAWSGDVFLNRAYYEEWKPPGSSWNQALIFEHMEYVRDRADVIVPGHGAPFRI